MLPAFDTGNPRTGPDFANAMGALLASGSAYLGTLPEAIFFEPQGSFWSPADHVRHLRLTSTPLVLALKLPRWVLALRFGRPAGGSRTFAEIREQYQELLASGATAGRFAPPAEPLLGDPRARRLEIMNGWVSVTVDLQNAIGKWPEGSLDSHQLPHPLLGTLTVREMLDFTVYHTAHHLRRVAERVNG
jgi:DinB superfamily